MYMYFHDNIVMLHSQLQEKMRPPLSTCLQYGSCVCGSVGRLSAAGGDTGSYVYHLVGREALRKWLTSTADDRINDEVNTNQYITGEWYDGCKDKYDNTRNVVSSLTP